MEGGCNITSEHSNREGRLFLIIKLSIHNVVNVCGAVKTFGNHGIWRDIQFPYKE